MHLAAVPLAAPAAARPAMGDGVALHQYSAPWATVDQVAAGSPAQSAGLVIGDQLVRFGTLDAAKIRAAHGGLQALAPLVRQGSDVFFGGLRHTMPPYAAAGSLLFLSAIPRRGCCVVGRIFLDRNDGL
eukprot:SAG11_NODE_1526_length_4741_cov_1.622576_3_plen_129_part_00